MRRVTYDTTIGATVPVSSLVNRDTCGRSALVDRCRVTDTVPGMVKKMARSCEGGDS
jgi:hypothetical protein